MALGIIFMMKFFNDVIDSPILLNEINLNVLIRPTRNLLFVKLNQCSLNYEFLIHLRSSVII